MRNFLRTVYTKIGIVQNVLENKPSSPATSLPASPAGNNILVKTQKIGLFYDTFPRVEFSRIAESSTIYKWK